MEIEFEHVTQNATVHSFDDGVLKYKVTFLHSDKTKKAQLRDIIFPIKNGILTVYKTGDESEDELVQLLSKRLHEEYSHDIKKVEVSSFKDLI